VSDIDDWLSIAARRAAAPLAGATYDALDARLDDCPAPFAIADRRDNRRAVLCTTIAAMFGFVAMETAAGVAFARPAPTWVAAPSAASPFSLLVGR